MKIIHKCLVAAGLIFTIFFVWLWNARTTYTKVDDARQTVGILKQAVQLFREKRGNYPSDLRELINEYISEDALSDPWGGKFVYKKSDESFDIYSIGANGIDEAGSGDDVSK